MTASMIGTAAKSLLGKSTPYCASYDPTLLFAIPRSEKRVELSIDANALPFSGMDLWTGYEVSWLNVKGKPIVAIAEFAFSAASVNLIESKSFKLYLNSFNGTRFENEQQVISHMTHDLTQACGMAVEVRIFTVDAYDALKLGMEGECIDDLDVTIDNYKVNPSLLTVDMSEFKEQVLHSHLLKSNCLVTGQPDWGSVVIRYKGPAIDKVSLLKYLVSFREHNEFHEQCVERIFTDLMRHCNCEKLTVYARYVRRGGLDINPYRSNFEHSFNRNRTARQ